VDLAGAAPRELLTPPPGYRFLESLAWSPDGRRLAYGKLSLAGDEFAIESYDFDTGQTSEILSDPKAGAFCWTPDGRIIYARVENHPIETSANLWELSVDTRTGRVRGQPRRLTNWGGFLFGSLETSADSKHLSFVRQRFRRSIYVGQLQANGARLAAPKRLTFDEWFDWPTGWTRDSRSLLFHSDRGGDLDAFRQSLDGRGAQPVAAGPGDARDPRETPDGRWILYLAWPSDSGRIRTAEGRLMRVAVEGGSPEVVLRVAGYPGPIRVNPDASVPAVEPVGYPRFRCPSFPEAPCVLGEQAGDQVVFTAFDPIKGRKGEVTRTRSSQTDRSSWDLSPDGRWIAFATREETRARIRLLPLAGQAPREISADGWVFLESVAWAADGKSLFATSYAPDGSSLLHVSLDGNVRVIHKVRFFIENPVPSPDGRYLAFGDITPEGNIWLIDNLR
jgi:Tol biopolymer transport system component